MKDLNSIITDYRKIIEKEAVKIWKDNAKPINYIYEYISVVYFGVLLILMTFLCFSTEIGWMAEHQQVNSLAHFIITSVQNNRIVEILFLIVYYLYLILFVFLLYKKVSSFRFGVDSGFLLLCKKRTNYLDYYYVVSLENRQKCIDGLLEERELIKSIVSKQGKASWSTITSFLISISVFFGFYLNQDAVVALLIECIFLVIPFVKIKSLLFYDEKIDIIIMDMLLQDLYNLGIEYEQKEENMDNGLSDIAGATMET